MCNQTIDVRSRERFIFPTCLQRPAKYTDQFSASHTSKGKKKSLKIVGARTCLAGGILFCVPEKEYGVDQMYGWKRHSTVYCSHMHSWGCPWFGPWGWVGGRICKFRLIYSSELLGGMYQRIQRIRIWELGNQRSLQQACTTGGDYIWDECVKRTIHFKTWPGNPAKGAWNIHQEFCKRTTEGAPQTVMSWVPPQEGNQLPQTELANQARAEEWPHHAWVSREPSMRTGRGGIWQTEVHRGHQDVEPMEWVRSSWDCWHFWRRDGSFMGCWWGVLF